MQRRVQTQLPVTRSLILECFAERELILRDSPISREWALNQIPARELALYSDLYFKQSPKPKRNWRKERLKDRFVRQTQQRTRRKGFCCVERMRDSRDGEFYEEDVVYNAGGDAGEMRDGRFTAIARTFREKLWGLPRRNPWAAVPYFFLRLSFPLLAIKRPGNRCIEYPVPCYYILNCSICTPSLVAALCLRFLAVIFTARSRCISRLSACFSARLRRNSLRKKFPVADKTSGDHQKKRDCVHDRLPSRPPGMQVSIDREQAANLS